MLNLVYICESTGLPEVAEYWNQVTLSVLCASLPRLAAAESALSLPPPGLIKEQSCLASLYFRRKRRLTQLAARFAFNNECYIDCFSHMSCWYPYVVSLVIVCFESKPLFCWLDPFFNSCYFCFRFLGDGGDNDDDETNTAGNTTKR